MPKRTIERKIAELERLVRDRSRCGYCTSWPDYIMRFVGQTPTDVWAKHSGRCPNSHPFDGTLVTYSVLAPHEATERSVAAAIASVVADDLRAEPKIFRGPSKIEVIAGLLDADVAAKQLQD